MGECDKNVLEFRLAQVIQDWAYLKIETDQYDDAILHLQEVESMLRNIKKDSSVNNYIYNAVKKRQSELSKRCNEEGGQYQDYLEELEEQKKNDTRGFMEKISAKAMIGLAGATFLGAALSREAVKRLL